MLARDLGRPVYAIVCKETGDWGREGANDAIRISGTMETRVIIYGMTMKLWHTMSRASLTRKGWRNQHLLGTQCSSSDSCRGRSSWD